MMEERIISESKPKVQKVESDDIGSDFDYYKSEGKIVHVDIEKEQPKETNQH